MTDAPEPELPPTNNVVVQALRAVDVTDREAVAAEVARSQTSRAYLVQARQRHEMDIHRLNNELLRIEADRAAIYARAESQIAVIRRDMEEDLAIEYAKARDVDTAKRAAQAAIDMLDGGA